jgi:hypothetical protein
MRFYSKIIILSVATLTLCSCGKDFNTGFGEYEGWGGYTKGFGDIDGYGDKQVGLCSYTGGCMPEKATEGGPSISAPKRGDAGAGDAGE